MKLLNAFCHCAQRLLLLLAVLVAPAVFAQGIIYVQLPPTVRSTNGLPPGVTPITFPEDALGTYVGDALPIVINGQTVCTFTSGLTFSVAGVGIIGQQPYSDFPDNVWVVPLSAGTEIGPSAAVYGWFDNGLLAASIDGGTIGVPPLTSGYFAGAESAYVGFDFQKDGQTYYGWMEVGSPYALGTGGQGWVYNYAYETTPNTPIFAGEVPEPATWGLVAVGALAFLRRRKIAC